MSGVAHARPAVTTTQAYVGHLLAGGTTTWADWLSRPAGPHPVDLAPVDLASPDLASLDLPAAGAAQAELLRRLNAAPPGPRPELARRVLGRAAPGRGMVDLRLLDPPAAVPADELLRVGAGVLADVLADALAVALAVGAPTSPMPPVLPPRRALWRRGRTHRLEGPPVTVAALRDRLEAAGSFELGRRPALFGRSSRQDPDRVVLVVRPLASALAEVWSARVQRGSGRTWASSLTEWQRTGLPPTAAYAGRAATWADRIGVDHVHLVTGGEDLDEQLAAALGWRPADHPQDEPRPVDLPAARVEVLRHVNQVLPFRIPDGPTRMTAIHRLVGLLHDLPAARPRPALPGVPAPHRNWVTHRAAALADRLRAGGYPAHGPIADTLSGEQGSGEGPPLPSDDVLEAIVHALLRSDVLVAEGAGR